MANEPFVHTGLMEGVTTLRQPPRHLSRHDILGQEQSVRA